MPALTNVDEFIGSVKLSGLIDAGRLDTYLGRLGVVSALPSEPAPLAQVLVRSGLLTKYQAEQLLCGRWKNFEIGGKYRILERLGDGGMACVFLCEHMVMRRLVALKILHAEQAENPDVLDCFYREARASARMQHPNVVTTFDVDRFDGLPYLVMEYVDGRNLGEMVRTQGALDPFRAAHYVAQAARGLQHIHEAGLVHRDIKPGNLLVDRRGTVKLLDLGLARIVQEEPVVAGKHKGPRYVVGTLDYMAPEQARGSRDVDIRSDIYGLGSTFYHLLAGHEPFHGASPTEKFSWLQFRRPRPIELVRLDVPVRLVEILERMMAKDPAERYQAPAEVAEALDPWVAEPISPPTEEELPQLSLAVRRLHDRFALPATPAPMTLAAVS